MESEQPATSSPAVPPRPDGNASAEPLASPRSGCDSSTIDKADESLSFSSDAGDQTTLRHPKGKRKRTTAKDKAILEAAYQVNPKPDKTARLELVRQVSLNEKEVQNRRQNYRRRCRPLSDQELVAYTYGGYKALARQHPSSANDDSLSGYHPSFCDGSSTSSPPHYQPFTSASMTNALISTTPASSPETDPWLPDALAQKEAAQRQQQSRETAPDRNTHGPAPAAAQTTPSGNSSFSSSVGSVRSVGYLSNRWNMHSSLYAPSSSSAGNAPAHSDHTRDEPARLESLPRPSSGAPVLPPPQQQMPSQQPHQRPFRLSLSLEGKAEVISGQSPSPPRRLPPPNPTVPVLGRTGSSSSSNGSDSPLPSLPAIGRSGLGRSQSALPSVDLTLPPISSLTNSLDSGSVPPPPPAQPAHPPRLLRGRSRDVHAWESVCDAETRVDDELSAHAEEEASGSAIAAISLLRSTSSLSTASATSSSVLQPNGHKRNSSSRSGIPRPGMKRAKLGRALSSVARMQNIASGPRDWQQETGKDKVWADAQKKKLKLSTLLSGNDSDKENWSPDEEGRPRFSVHQGAHGRRPLPAARSGLQKRPVLGGDASKAAKNSPLATRMNGGKAGGAGDAGFEIYEYSPPKRAQLSRAATIAAPNDVDRFMHGDQVSPSKKGDMDCIAGLLSLSQGNWR